MKPYILIKPHRQARELAGDVDIQGMKDKEFQQLAGEGLHARISELKAEYYGAKAEVMSGKSKNTAALKLMRRRIARAMTELGSKVAL